MKDTTKQIDQAKNRFLEWLEQNEATDVEVYVGEPKHNAGWDYYSHVYAFVGSAPYSVFFMIWKGGEPKIDYRRRCKRYNGLSIEEFYPLLD